MLSDFIQIPQEIAILTAKNQDVKVINDLILGCIPTSKVSCLSTDHQVCDDGSQLLAPVEILNTIENGSLPPHVLDLKINVPFMVIRNIDSAAGICNCTRLIVTLLGTNVIEAVIATGSHAGNIALIRKIKFISLDTEGVSPFDFTRSQLPVRLAFAMIINKAQGQTLDSVGLYLPCHVFGHGPLYVALLRVISPGAIKILITDDISIVEKHTGSYTHNVVFKEVFNNP